MTILPKETENDNAIIKCCEGFIKRFGVNRLLRNANATKEKGVPTYDIFAFLMALIFTGKNLYTLLQNHREKISFGKDTVYRFLSKSTISWEQFVLNLSLSVLPEVDKLTSEDRKTALIIDDSPYYYPTD